MILFGVEIAVSCQWSRFACLSAVLFSSFACADRTDAEDQAGLDYFEKNVRPLLSRHCYECHAEKNGKRKGGLVLDRRTGWVQGGDSGTAVVSRKPEVSLLISAVRYDGLEMPPKGKLPETSIRILEKWVAMGAPAPGDKSIGRTESTIDFEESRRFWSFRPPVNHPVPTLKDERAGDSDIDRFINSARERNSLQQVRSADRHEWLRRVTFDLSGLPPTIAELNAFLADESSVARQTVVDRLLADSTFGEHWGRHWLDLARYADSNGGDINLTYFNAWRFRDYVVNAFNDDKPFDQFIREQIAGDLLDSESPADAAEKMIATGFLVIGPKMLSERNKEKLYMDVVDEQLDTIGRVFLGLTVGCARCHDHKFDPIPATDYYAMAGILRSTETVFGIRMGNVNVSGWLEQRLPLNAEDTNAVARYEAEDAALQKQLNAVKAELTGLEKNTLPKPEDLPGIVVDDEMAELIGFWKKSTYTKRYVGKGYIHDEKKELGRKSVIFRPDLPVDGEYEVRISYASGNGRATNVPVMINSADGETSVTVNQVPQPDIRSLFKSLGRFQFDAGESGYVRISNTSTDGYVIVDAAQFIPVDKLNDSPTIAGKKNDDPERFAKLNKQVESLTAAQKKLRDGAPDRPEAMAVRDHKEVADCELRIRGVADNRGDSVPRGFLTIASTDESPQIDSPRSGRAELAARVSDARNPLTARVLVNRVWMHLLGEGIVRSVDNLGKLGDRPSHPRLLDKLAVEFMENGWSIKQLIRRICLSRVYGLSTEFSAEAHRIDPDNRFLWRQRRRRLTAEEIRDAMLAVSSRLSEEVGGSSVKDFGEQAVKNAPQAENDDKREVSLRRSLYLPIVRNDLPPMLTIFDFADPDVVTGRRNTTNVPAQALLMLNSPFVRECADALSEQLETADDLPDDRHRIEWLYLRLLARKPTTKETGRAISFVETSKEGDDKPADWTSLIHSLMASSEFRMIN